ncbi:MAG: B12-binding domain-containing protein [Desulfobacterales bacterium]|nr:B12-binding domain-containing protein [Desulfobacterales bacterium]
MKDKLKAAFLGMNRQKAIGLVEKAIPAGEDPFGILKTCRAAMEKVGKRFETGEFFLSELICSAEVFKAVCAILDPGLMAKRGPNESRINRQKGCTGGGASICSASFQCGTIRSV